MPKSPEFVLPESFLEAARRPANAVPFFIGKRGHVIRVPFIGGGSQPPGEGGSGDGGEGGTGEGEGGTDNKGDDSGTEDDADEDAEEGDAELPETVKAVLRKNRAATRAAEKALAKAEKAKEAAEKKAKEYEDKNKTALERAEERATTAEKAVADLKTASQGTALRAAFLQNTGVAWADVDDAFDAAMSKFGLADLEVGDNGRVDSKKVDKIIKQLAKDKPHLVKAAETGTGSTGGSFNGNRGGGTSGGGKDKAALAKKYPALRGRSDS